MSGWHLQWARRAPRLRPRSWSWRTLHGTTTRSRAGAGASGCIQTSAGDSRRLLCVRLHCLRLHLLAHARGRDHLHREGKGWPGWRGRGRGLGTELDEGLLRARALVYRHSGGDQHASGSRSMCHILLLGLLWVSLELGGDEQPCFWVRGRERRCRCNLGVCDDMLRVWIEAVDELL